MTLQLFRVCVIEKGCYSCTEACAMCMVVFAYYIICWEIAGRGGNNGLYIFFILIESSVPDTGTPCLWSKDEVFLFL